MQTMPHASDGVANATSRSDAPPEEHVHRQPVLTRPYGEPKRHWKTVSDETRNEIVNRRRPADEPLPMGQTVATQQDLGFGDDRAEAGAINKLRSEVREWRDQGWPGASNATRELLEYWSREPGKARSTACSTRNAKRSRRSCTSPSAATARTGWSSA